MTKFFVYSEFAITFSTLFKTLFALLFKELPLGWLISFPWIKQYFFLSVTINSKLFQWSAIIPWTLLSFKYSLISCAFLIFLRNLIPPTLSIEKFTFLSNSLWFSYWSAKTLIIKFLDISFAKPHIKLCIPPTSGGKDLVTIKYINYFST